MPKNLAKIFSAELEGITAHLIEVEVDLNVGLHSFTIVGLGDKAVGEAKERVNSALKNIGVKPPNRENRKITVNLAPADIKKTGSQYDLAVALGYLLATGQMKEFDPSKILFLGELALDGRVRAISGALAISEMAKSRGYSKIFVPKANANEASAVEEIQVIGVNDLSEAISILEGKSNTVPHTFEENKNTILRNHIDFQDIKGQGNAKRALTISAAGGHNLLLVGPPGTGKSLLAQALPGILPKLDRSESIELTKIWSAAGLPVEGLIQERPFRSPHQTASATSVVGGGTDPKPGEISLAHHGVLFLDELPEFPRSVLEGLRGPLESGAVRVARAKATISFPARFTLLAAMNPCPCGYFGDQEKECSCSAFDVLRYQRKISGPLLDRIDLQLRVPRVPLENLRQGISPESSTEEIRTKVEEARGRQAERFKQHPGKINANSEMSSKDTEQYVNLEKDAEKFLLDLTERHLSPRGYYRLLKTALTIADLEGSDTVASAHLAEAFGYRLKEEF